MFLMAADFDTRNFVPGILFLLVTIAALYQKPLCMPCFLVIVELNFKDNLKVRPSCSQDSDIVGLYASG